MQLSTINDEALSPVTPQRVRDIASECMRNWLDGTKMPQGAGDELRAVADQLERNAEVLSQCKYFVDMAASTHPSATVRKSALILSERLLPKPPEAK